MAFPWAARLLIGVLKVALLFPRNSRHCSKVILIIIAWYGTELNFQSFTFFTCLIRVKHFVTANYYQVVTCICGQNSWITFNFVESIFDTAISTKYITVICAFKWTVASVVEPGSNLWIYNMYVDLLSYEIRLLNGIDDSDNSTNLLSQKSKVNISVILC